MSPECCLQQCGNLGPGWVEVINAVLISLGDVGPFSTSSHLGDLRRRVLREKRAVSKFKQNCKPDIATHSKCIAPFFLCKKLVNPGSFSLGSLILWPRIKRPFHEVNLRTFITAYV